MQIKLFTIPIWNNGSSLEEMNRFLRANKILEVENHMVSNEGGASWCFCVKYLPSAQPFQTHKNVKKDYKAIMNVCHPVFEKFQIHHSYATCPAKGKPVRSSL
jgi:hypothetical protein